MSLHHFVITIDGPTASGKGAIARYIAHVYGGVALDAGYLYRYVGFCCHRAGLNPHDHPTVGRYVADLLTRFVPDVLVSPDLRAPEVGKYAALYGEIPAVRTAIIQIQRQFAQNPPLNAQKYSPSVVILDGHTCGREVYPDANLMFHITADIHERAARRHRELTALGFDADHNQILNEMTANDYRDVMRALPPDTPDQDVIMIDTTGRDLVDVGAEISDYIHDILGIFPIQPDGDITKHDQERE